MKRIISIFLVLILCMSVVPSALAADTSGNHGIISTITVPDKNGNSVQYNVKNNAITTIPIYSSKQSDGTVSTMGLEEIAVLTITIANTSGTYTAWYTFTPVGVSWLTAIGFVGNMNTYQSGFLYGSRYFGIIPVMSGFVSAPVHGTGSLSGSYYDLAYAPVPIIQGFVW